jgi:hypothetical protein
MNALINLLVPSANTGLNVKFWLLPLARVK